MHAGESTHAPLTAAMIRRAAPLAAANAETFPPVEAAASSRWREDLRLFAVTWAMGFVFFLAFIG